MRVLDCHGASGLFIKDQHTKVQISPEQFSPASFIKKMKISISVLLYPQAKVSHRVLESVAPTDTCDWSLIKPQQKSIRALTSASLRSDHLTLRT